MSSSKSTVFTDEELEALQVWAMPDVSGSEKSEKEEDSPDANRPRSPLLTVQDIEAMQQQAYDEAFAKGQEEGFAQGYEAGRQQGYEEGLKKGYDENAHKLHEQAAQLTEILQAFNEPLADLDVEVEKELVGLAIAIAKQLIRREIKSDPGQIVATVREAVNVLPIATQRITLTLHPEDAELVRSVLLLEDHPAPWEIKEDPLISRGGCRVDTESSHVDATVERRLAAVIAQVLGDERGREEGG
ncbi:MAG: flagellar assembly protein FliH [Methylomicrobium sp.]